MFLAGRTRGWEVKAECALLLNVPWIVPIRHINGGTTHARPRGILGDRCLMPTFVVGFQRKADSGLVQERVTADSAAEAVRLFQAKYPAPAFKLVFITPARGDKPKTKDGD